MSEDPEMDGLMTELMEGVAEAQERGRQARAAKENDLELRVTRLIAERVAVAIKKPMLDKHEPGMTGLDARMIAREVIGMVRGG